MYIESINLFIFCNLHKRISNHIMNDKSYDELINICLRDLSEDSYIY